MRRKIGRERVVPRTPLPQDDKGLESGRRGLGPRPLQDISLLEAFDSGGFIVLHVEDGVKLGDLEQVVHLLGEVQKFELSTLVLGGGESADQLADAGAVDVVDLRQVQYDFLVSFGKQVAHGVAQGDATLAERDSSAAVHNGDPVHLPSTKFHAH